MDQVTVKCIDTGIEQPADVLKRSAYHLRIVFGGTTTPLNMFRKSLRRPFVGRAGNLEFVVRVDHKQIEPVPQVVLVNTMVYSLGKANEFMNMGPAGALQAKRHLAEVSKAALKLAEIL